MLMDDKQIFFSLLCFRTALPTDHLSIKLWGRASYAQRLCTWWFFIRIQFHFHSSVFESLLSVAFERAVKETGTLILLLVLTKICPSPHPHPHPPPPVSPLLHLCLSRSSGRVKLSKSVLIIRTGTRPPASVCVCMCVSSCHCLARC